ncbi:glypican-1-like [Oncorhynchus nerka]|uniref:glypican-1-like n=1 Tax=Oncorhynchus nerka TaxID=8023 RepID=UPI001132480B|nr:glypican-1-like [Oncorhynchus nerka]
MDFLPALLIFFLSAVPLSADNANSKARSCLDVRQFYSGKGFTLNGVPQTEISGEHLRICPQGYTCCTSAMEETLSNLSRREFEGLVREAGRSLQASLNTQYRSFDTYFTDLLNRSERSLQESFLATLGSLYSKNAPVFQDLYADLRRYYRGSAVNLEETLNDFWARLLERLFKASSLPQYTLTDDYLECVAKQTETLRPFGDVPRDLKPKVTRAFVAARSFVQGLTVSGEVVRKVSQVPLSPECTRAMMKLVYCPHCRGLASVKPCANYCRNVMKGCLANQADLDTEWQNLIDTMLQVASSFSADPSVDVVIHSLPIRISEAILYMQENTEVFTSKVFQACGTPRLADTQSSGSEERKKRVNPASTAMEYKPSPTVGVPLEMQISDVSSKLREMQQYWVQLPAALCNSKVAAGAAGDKCWNGMTKARYLPEVMGDGLASQINNPEVEIDITKPDMTIRQQIMQLKIMTNRLRNALNGNDVDFQDASDDISGSGSGMCTGESCARSGPRVIVPKTDSTRYYNPPENKKVKATGTQTHPSILLPLLSLATLLLRR